MPKIKVISSMALDAICYLEKCFLSPNEETRLHPVQLNFMNKINASCIEKLGNEYVPGSTLCLALTAFVEGESLESLSLGDLVRIFENPEKFRATVQKNIHNEFTASYVYPELDYLVEGAAAVYVENMKIIEKAGFAQIWEADLLPIIRAKIAEKQAVYEKLDFVALAKDIQKMKQCPPIDDVKIYVSVLSYPTAFTLFNGDFLENIGGGEGAGMICHELMHGFSNEKIENLYVEYVKKGPYLARKHEILTVEMQSGNEEEFVMAAEYYLRLKHTGESKSTLLKKCRYYYDDCTPVAVFLIDLLSQESETPNGYAQWLSTIFESNRLPQTDIERHLNELAP